MGAVCAVCQAPLTPPRRRYCDEVCAYRARLRRAELKGDIKCGLVGVRSMPVAERELYLARNAEATSLVARAIIAALGAEGAGP